MRKLITILLFSVLIPFCSKAQYVWDFGGRLGVTNYLGEIGGNLENARPFIMDMRLNATRWSAGGFARYKAASFLFVKANLNYLRIAGADKYSSNIGRNLRNLSFFDDMLELSVQADIAFFAIPNIGGGYNDLKFYGFLGGGMLYFSPKTVLNGKTYSLRDYKTENVKYSPFTAVIPVGLGADFSFQRKYRVGIELGWRKTFTDYLDDVSSTYPTNAELGNDPIRIALSNRTPELNIQADATHPTTSYGEVPGDIGYNRRGNSKTLDSYFIVSANFSYILRGKSSFYRSRFGTHFGKGKKRKFRARF